VRSSLSICQRRKRTRKTAVELIPRQPYQSGDRCRRTGAAPVRTHRPTDPRHARL